MSCLRCSSALCRHYVLEGSFCHRVCFLTWLFATDNTLCLLLFHSAGVGRTGTFIVIDSMIDMMHMEQRLDVFGFVSRIREQRCQLIQTDVSVDPSRPVVPRTDSRTRSQYLRHKRRRSRKQQCLRCKNSRKLCDKTKAATSSTLFPLTSLFFLLRCSTPSSTRLCWNTICTETPSWMCALWRAICRGFTTPGLPTTGWAWRRSSG